MQHPLPAGRAGKSASMADVQPLVPAIERKMAAASGRMDIHGSDSRPANCYSPPDPICGRLCHPAVMPTACFCPLQPESWAPPSCLGYLAT